MASILTRLANFFPGFKSNYTPNETPVQRNDRILAQVASPSTQTATQLPQMRERIDNSIDRPRPTTEERVPSNYGAGIAGRVWFLPYFESTTHDTPQIRAAMRLMIRDPFVLGAWVPAICNVASEDPQVQPSEAGNEYSEEQAKFITSSFENDTIEGIPGLIKSILMPLGPDGFSLCEKVWGLSEMGLTSGKITCEKLAAKDPNWLRVEGDRFSNVNSVVSIRRASERYPIEDFVYARYLSIFNEALGLAAFRAPYGAYWMRDTVRKLRIIHCEKKMAGFLMGTYAAAGGDVGSGNADKQALDTALAAAKTQTWISVPDSCKIQALALTTASEPDYKSFDDSLKEEIVTGITFAHLQMMQGTSDSDQGNSQVHEEKAELLPWLLMSIAIEVINKQLIKDLIDFNFPYPAAGGYPKLTLGAVSNKDLLEQIQVLEGAQALGFQNLSKKHYAKALSLKLADDTNPDDALKPAGQQAPGGMPGMPGAGGPPTPGSPFDQDQGAQGAQGAQDDSGQPPMSDFSGFSERSTGNVASWRKHSDAKSITPMTGLSKLKQSLYGDDIEPKLHKSIGKSASRVFANHGEDWAEYHPNYRLVKSSYGGYPAVAHAAIKLAANKVANHWKGGNQDGRQLWGPAAIAVRKIMGGATARENKMPEALGGANVKMHMGGLDMGKFMSYAELGIDPDARGLVAEVRTMIDECLAKHGAGQLMMSDEDLAGLVADLIGYARPRTPDTKGDPAYPNLLAERFSEFQRPAASEVAALVPRFTWPPERFAEPIRAAGVLFQTSEGKHLFLRRAGGSEDHRGQWALPGGKVEAGESLADAAHREAREETGYGNGVISRSLTTKVHNSNDGNVDFTTFLHHTHEFTPKLNDEHDAYKWATASDAPAPLHPGLEWLRSHKFAEFKPDEHPRGQPDNKGQFATKGGGSEGSAQPEAKTAELPKSEKSKAKVRYKDSSQKITVERLLGKDPKAAAELVGAPDDATVVLQAYEDNGPKVYAKIVHPKIEKFERTMGVDGEGKKYIHNDNLFINPKYQGEGLGSDIFAKEVESASERGFSYIGTHAGGNARTQKLVLDAAKDRFGHDIKSFKDVKEKAGGPEWLENNQPMNGYYTWPSLGYDQELNTLSELDESQLKEIGTKFPKAKTVLDIFDSPGGSQWWKDNGVGMEGAKFDLTPGSRSMLALAHHQATRSKDTTKSNFPQTKKKRWGIFGENDPATQTNDDADLPMAEEIKE